MPRQKGQLPKAYLRIDPNIDQHPDMPLLIKLICAANRQTPRGCFKTWGHVVTALGAKRAQSAKDRRHILPNGDAWDVQDWSHWQEGDLTVGERMRALRERYKTVTPTVTPAVTPTVTPPVTVTATPSEASGVKASGTDNPPTLPHAREGERPDPHGAPGETEALQCQLLRAMDEALPVCRLPYDVLLTKASQTPRGDVIDNIRNCRRPAWLRTTLSRLAQIRMRAEADQRDGPARASPLRAAEARQEGAIAEIQGGLLGREGVRERNRREAEAGAGRSGGVGGGAGGPAGLLPGSGHDRGDA